jgi:hypothetical protein
MPKNVTALRGSLLLFVSDAYRVYRFVYGELLKAFKGNNSLERRLFGHALAEWLRKPCPATPFSRVADMESAAF